MDDTQPGTTLTAEPQTATYHWVLTVQTSQGRIASRDGTCEPRPGDTRRSFFNHMVRGLEHDLGDHVAVLHFSLEKNQI